MTQPGKIYLRDRTFTGALKVAYATASGSLVNENDKFDILPMWRSLLSGEQIIKGRSLSEAVALFEKLYAVTRQESWRLALESAKASLHALSIPQSNYFFKREESGEVLSYPGTWVESDHTELITTAQRLNDGMVRLTVPDNSNNGIVRFVNRDITLDLTAGTLIETELSANEETILNIAIAVNDEKWIGAIAVPSGNVVQKTEIKTQDFLQWPDNNQWRASDPSIVSSGNTGSATQRRINLEIDDLSPVLAVFDLAAGLDQATATITSDRLSATPEKLTYILSGAAVTLRIADSKGWNWDRILPTTGGKLQTVALNWAEFRLSALQSNTGQKPKTPATGIVKSWQFLGTSQPSTLSIFSIGELPKRLESDITLESISIETTKAIAHQFSIGDIGIAKGVSLQYQPNVIQSRILASNSIVTGSEGLAYIWQQTPSEQAYNFWLDAQDAYHEQTGILAPMVPAYRWSGNASFTWDSEEYSLKSGVWQAKCQAIAASGWTQFPELASIVVSRWLEFLDKRWGLSATAIATFDPFPTNGVDVAILALYCKTAILANLAGGDRSLTFRIIQKTIQPILSGLEFLGRSPNLRDGFTVTTVLDTLSLLLRYKQSLNYPLPSDSDTTDSDFATKIIEANSFSPPLNLPKHTYYGFKFKIPIDLEA